MDKKLEEFEEKFPILLTDKALTNQKKEIIESCNRGFIWSHYHEHRG